MSHLELHEHAFLNLSNVVINIAVFQEQDHDSALINDVMCLFEGAVKAICCCTFGRGEIGQSWDEETSSWVIVPETLLDPLDEKA
jgi:hypothetical protein